MEMRGIKGVLEMKEMKAILILRMEEKIYYTLIQGQGRLIPNEWHTLQQDGLRGLPV